jgi:hypothetical protein
MMFSENRHSGGRALQIWWGIGQLCLPRLVKADTHRGFFQILLDIRRLSHIGFSENRQYDGRPLQIWWGICQLQLPRLVKADTHRGFFSDFTGHSSAIAYRIF